VSLWRFAGYFLKLGALGFGGPVALAHAMRRDLVDERHWIEAEEYEDGLALAAACPGPMAFQLAVYLGFIRFGIAGAAVVAVAFALPPFILVVIAAAAYGRLSATWQLRAVFYGVAPAIVAIIAKACFNLGAKTLRRDFRAWLVASAALVVVLVYERELAIMFVIAGVAGIALYARPPRATTLSIVPAGVLFLFFFKTGMMIFGSGLVIVPFLKTQIVDQFHWLNDRQFLDSVAIGLISPGPVVITATFVGYLLSGIRGAAAATAGIFLPPVLFVIIATPFLRRYRTHPVVSGFVRGIGSCVVGVLIATTWLVARSAVVDWRTAAIAIGAIVLVTLPKRIPEPAIITASAVAGLLVYRQ
jgi:chromate transporter